MENQEEITYIRKHFNAFFTEKGYALKSSTLSEIVFENNYSLLIFSFTTQYSIAFEELFFASKVSGKKYTIEFIVEFLHRDLRFKELLKNHMGEFGALKMTAIQAYSILLPKYLSEILETGIFSWE